MSMFKEGQQVKIINDLTQHKLAIGSIQTIAYVGAAYGLPYIVILDATQRQPLRHVLTQDVQPLDTLIA